MKLIFAIFVSLAFLTGCSGNAGGVNEALALRQSISQGAGCSFSARLTADYGDRVCEFAVDCRADPTGTVDFTVVEPESIQGISGSVSEDGGKLLFDDQVLLFEPLMDGQVTPAIGPWLMIKALLSGYIRSVSDTDGILQITIDDSFAGESFQLILTLDKDRLPQSGEIIWKNRRILTVQVENFTKL